MTNFHGDQAKKKIFFEKKNPKWPIFKMSVFQNRKDQSMKFSQNFFENWRFWKSAILDFFCLIPMKICHKLCDRMNGTQFWCFPWFPANSLLFVILRYTVYFSMESLAELFQERDDLNQLGCKIFQMYLLMELLCMYNSCFCWCIIVHYRTKKY